MLARLQQGWHILIAEPQTLEPNGLIGASVIIPFRNEAEHLPQLLNCLSAQIVVGCEVEFLLIDDNSTDSGAKLIEEFAISCSHEIRVVKNKGLGKKSAVATGVATAMYDIIVQTDADCAFGPLWLSEMIQMFSSETEMVLGMVRMKASENFWSKFSSLEYASLQASGAAMVALGNPIMGSAANMAYRKRFWNSAFQEGSERDSGDDVFLIQKANHVKMSHSESSLVYTQAPDSLAEVLNQRARWGAKSTSYSSKMAKAIALLVATYSLAVFLLLVVGIANWQILIMALCMLLVKAIVDYPFLKAFAAHTNQCKVLQGYIINAFVYPLYIVLALVFMVIGKPKWKGRVIR